MAISSSATLFGDAAEEALDLVEPGTRCRCEVHMKAGMPFEPGLDLGMLVRCVIVSDEMHVEVWQRLGLPCGAET